MRNSIKIAICGLALLMGASNIHAGNREPKYKLVYKDGPTQAEHNCLNIIYNKELSKDDVAIFDVVANNPENKIHGCILDIKIYPMLLKLVPVSGNKPDPSILEVVSTAGFGGELGRAIGVMDQDGRCRMATAIRAKGGDPTFALPAQGVLMRFAIGLADHPRKGPMVPSINTKNCGLVSADDEIIYHPLIRINMGKLVIE